MYRSLGMKVMRVCQICGAEVMTTARNLKYCDKCRREQNLKKMAEYRERTKQS